MKRLHLLVFTVVLSLLLTACGGNASEVSSTSLSTQAHGDRFSFTVQHSQIEVNPELDVVFLSVNLKPDDPNQPFTSPWSQQVQVQDGLVDLPSEIVDIWLWAPSQEELNLQIGDRVTLRIVNNEAVALAEYQVQILNVTHIPE